MRFNRVKLNLYHNTTIRSCSDYIKSIVKSTTRSCIRVTTIGADSGHIRFGVITTATNDTKVVATRIEDNKSSNNYTIVNRNTWRATTNLDNVLQYEVQQLQIEQNVVQT